MRFVSHFGFDWRIAFASRLTPTVDAVRVQLMIVPTLCVGMPQGTLRVPALVGTQSVPGCIPTRSVGTINA